MMADDGVKESSNTRCALPGSFPAMWKLNLGHVALGSEPLDRKDVMGGDRTESDGVG
jgi:hypothetical protein